MNIFGVALPELDWDKIWPLAVIALGIGTLWGTWSRMSPGGRTRQGG